MKKFTALLLVSFLVVAGLQAQTPQYYNYNNVGSSSNTFPFGQTAGKAVNWLFLAGDFNQPSPCPSGQQITKVYFFITTGGTRTFTDLQILMAQDNITTLTSGQFYAGPWDTVYFHASETLTGPTNGWMSVTLDTPYPYDPSQSLVIFVGQCAGAGSGMYVRQNTPYAGGDGSIVNFGIDVEPAVTTGWTAQTSGVTTSLYTVSTVDRNVGWIGGAGGVVLRTTDGGENWTNVTGSPIGTADVYAICGLDANTCLVSTSPSATYVYRTTNGGSTWTEVFTQTGGFMDDIKFQNANTGIMYGDPVGSRWSLWKTTDGGATWDSSGMYLPQAGSEAGWNNSMWLSGNSVWFGTNNTRVYKSTDFGLTWTYGATTGSANSYSVAFNGDIGFTGQSVTLKSTDGGDNWASVTLPSTGTCYSFNGVIDRFWYCRGTRIFWSNDNGVNFDTQYVGTGTYQAMSLKQDDNIIRGWAVTSNGAIAMYNEQLVGVSNNQNQIPSNYLLLQNYPNPFNPSTKISFSLPKAGNVKLIVYDVLGREVATLVNEFTSAGIHAIDFNATNLSSGIYIYRIEAGNFTDTKKMILLK